MTKEDWLRPLVIGIWSLVIFLDFTMRTLLTLIALFATLVVPATARAGQPYLVSDSVAGNIWRIEDANGDGDALDIGERTLWADGLVSPAALEGLGDAIFAADSPVASGDNHILRLIDANGDGDALDVGESAVWADGLGAPFGLAYHQGSLYYSDVDSNDVWRLSDTNGDGDALDTGEVTLFADSLSDPVSLLSWNDRLLVTSLSSGEVFQLDDTNGDGDALDIGERVVIATGIDGPLGIEDDGEGGFFVSAFDSSTILHATDNNGDGDFLDVAEVLSYADDVFGSIEGPWGLANYATGGFLLADYDAFEVSLVHDNNGDGDALDIGEVVLFADGIDAPSDVVALIEGLPGDYNNNGTVDAADYAKWRDGLGTIYTESDYDVWREHFGETIGGGAGAGEAALAAVPEPGALVLLLVGGILARIAKRR